MSHLVILTGGFVRKNPNSPASPTEVLGGHHILDISSGGTGAANNTAALNRLFGAVTKGQFAVFDGTNVGLFSPGPNGRYLQSNSAAPFGLSWNSPAGGGGGAPAAHASTHQHGGSDQIATATAAANAIPKASSGGLLDLGWLPSMRLASPLGGGLRGLMSSPALSDRLKVFRGGGYESPSHAWLLNGGTNTHAQIDSHIAATTDIHGAVGGLVDLSSIQDLRNKRLIGKLYVSGSPVGGSVSFIIAVSPNTTQQYVRFTTTGGTTSPFYGLAINAAAGTGTGFSNYLRLSATTTGDSTVSPRDFLLQPAGEGYVRIAQGSDNAAGTNRYRRAVVANDFFFRTVELCSPAFNLAGTGTVTPTGQTNWNGSIATQDGALRYSQRDKVTYMYHHNSGTPRILSTDSWLMHAWSESKSPDKYFAFGQYDGTPDFFTDVYGFVFPYPTTVTEMTAWRRSPLESPLLQLRRGGAPVTSIQFLPGQGVRTTGDIYQNFGPNEPIQIYVANRSFGAGHATITVKRRYSP